MKQISAILLAIIILVSSLGQFVIYVHYVVNKNYYATVLCENKAKPLMQCNGRCHMLKEMKEQEKKEQSPTNPKKERQETVQFCQQNVQLSFNPVNEVVEQNALYILAKGQEVPFSFFHPPKV